MILSNMTKSKFVPQKNYKKAISEDQAQRFMDYFFNKGTLKSINKAYLVFTLWRTGRRISEIVGYRGKESSPNRCYGLTPSDLDPETKTISFSILKKMPVYKKNKQGQKRANKIIRARLFKKEQYIEPISYDEEFFDTLYGYVQELNIPSHKRIFPYDRSYVSQFIKKAAQELNIDFGWGIKVVDGIRYKVKYPINVHSFRHGFAKYFLAKMENNPNALPMLQEIMCHGSMEITKGYLRYNQSERRKALNHVFGVKKDV